LLIASGAFLGSKYLGQNKKIDELTNQNTSLQKSVADIQKQLDQVNKSESNPTNTVNTNPSSSKYLTVPEWGIKFQVPDGLDNIQYTIDGNTLWFKPPRDYSPCTLDNGRIFGIDRYTSVQGDGYGQFNESAINGYYFYEAGTGKTCPAGVSADSLNWHGDLDRFDSMAKTIQKS